MQADTAKRAAGEAAAELVEPAMVVGLGTGSTARWFTLALARRVAAGLRVRVVATSTHTAGLAVEHGLDLTELGRGGVDLAVDGADCVDPDLRLIKGRGGALVREKVVAAAARRFVVVVDAAKVREVLSGPLPVELLPFGSEYTLKLLDATGGHFELRRQGDGAPAVSDNGNLLADGEYSAISDPEGVSARLDAIPGLVGHGLFLGMADAVLVGHGDGHVDTVNPR